MDNNFIRGSVSGLITCTIVQPLDVIKTNIITVNKSFGIFESYSYVKNRYGLKGFWRGIRPAGYKAVIGSGMSFSFLESLKKIVPVSSVGFMSNTLIAVMSRGFTITVLAPLSIIKVRMEAPQVEGYLTVSDGFRKIYSQEGFKGFYQGIGPSLMRDLPFSGLAYGFYEYFSQVLFNLTGFNNIWLRGAAGAMAGFTATILTQPFDVIKTRQQFKNIGVEESFKYRNTLDALIQILRTEGIAGYTIGLRIRLIERCTGFTIVWFIYERLKEMKG